MSVNFKNPKEAIAALQANQSTGDAFHYLFSNKHPFVGKYLSANAYYQDAVERILLSESIAYSSQVYAKLASYGELFPFVFLALAGDAHQDDFNKYQFWRESLPKAFRTCFIINDDFAWTKLWEHVINRSPDHNLVIGTSKTIETSIESLIRQKPDIVVVDHMLPGTDGFEGTKILKDLLPNSAFVIVSHDYRDLGTIALAKEVGANMLWLYGPYRIPEIVKLLHKTWHNFQTGVQDYSSDWLKSDLLS